MPIVLITGANRGLGLEFVRQYSGEGWTVIAASRSGSAELEASGVRVEMLDMADPAAVSGFGSRIGEIDLLIANAGTYGPHDAEDSKGAGEWLDTFAVNTVGPYLLAKAVLPGLRARGGKCIAVSTRMGSLADNEAGGFLAYRSSKTALNMAWKTLALAEPEVICAMLHPGWVRTDMGGPNAPLGPQESVAGMRRVIATLEKGDSGRFLDHRGEEVPW